MEIELKQVHIGQAIDVRRKELGLTKTEFGRRIDVPQQHVNRILERETIETSRLVRISEALDFNFFSLFCQTRPSISGVLAAISLGGNANNQIGDTALAAQVLEAQHNIEAFKATNEALKEQIELLKEQISRLDENLKDKNEIIELLKERRPQ